MPIDNPALASFLGRIQPGFVLAEVLIRREGDAFNLRHAKDAALQDSDLKELTEAGLRPLAQFTEQGAYRPLKSAPNLQRGWRYRAADGDALESALSRLYPGAVADWFAALAPEPPVTHFREFVSRQTGMYRIAAMLDDGQASTVARACCHARFCLKQRLWTTPELPAEPPGSKSAIPCLEPCALLLELARKAMRLEQAARDPLALGAEEMDTVRSALSAALSAGAGEGRAGDIAAPDNPRRIQLLLERLNSIKPAE